MSIFIGSKIPILSLLERYKNNSTPADFLVDDLIELFNHNDTCAVNDLKILFEKREKGQIKKMYKISVEEINTEKL